VRPRLINCEALKEYPAAWTHRLIESLARHKWISLVVYHTHAQNEIEEVGECVECGKPGRNESKSWILYEVLEY
jgi:hypothetical protein